jgi:hypothetical protein
MKSSKDAGQRLAMDLVYFVEWTNNLSQLIFLAIGMLLVMMVFLFLLIENTYTGFLGNFKVAGYAMILAFVAFAIITMYAIDRRRRQLESQLILESARK